MHVEENMQSFVLLKTKNKIKIILEIVYSTEFVGKTSTDKPGDYSKSQFSMMCKKNTGTIRHYFKVLKRWHLFFSELALGCT